MLHGAEVMSTEQKPLLPSPTQERALKWTVIAAIFSSSIASFVAAAGKLCHEGSVAPF